MTHTYGFRELRYYLLIINKKTSTFLFNKTSITFALCQEFFVIVIGIGMYVFSFEMNSD